MGLVRNKWISEVTTSTALPVYHSKSIERFDVKAFAPVIKSVAKFKNVPEFKTDSNINSTINNFDIIYIQYRKSSFSIRANWISNIL